jgi:hypothetical protein
MPFRETLLNIAITGVLVLIITLVAILVKESRPAPVAAIPVGKAAVATMTANSAAAPKAEFEVFPKARLVLSKNNEGDTLRILLDEQHDETIFTLYFVDTPEITLTHPQLVQEQARYFQISQDEVLKAGLEAAGYVTSLLKDRTFTLLTRWEPVPDRSR